MSLYCSWISEALVAVKGLITNRSFYVKEKQRLDPYKVGIIAGCDAFSTNDYVVLVRQNNKPAKVRGMNSDIFQSVRVILGDEVDSIYGESNYFASDLGYPLSSDLWSEHQKKWYGKCHSEQ